MSKFTRYTPLSSLWQTLSGDILCQQEITELELITIEQGQYITELELMLLEAAM